VASARCVDATIAATQRALATVGLAPQRVPVGQPA